MYSPIRDVVEEIDGNVFFHDADGEKCIADRANIPYIAQSEQDAKRFLGIHTNLPLIPDYAKTCSCHPNLLDGYKQWLEVVAQWGYDITEVRDGYQVWSMVYYQWPGTSTMVGNSLSRIPSNKGTVTALQNVTANKSLENSPGLLLFQQEKA